MTARRSTSRALGRDSIFVLATALATALACQQDNGHSWEAAAAEKQDDEPLPVAVTEISPARIARHYASSGTLQALRSAEIVALQPGVIKDIKVEEGSTVRKGRLLARLDGRELALQANAAKLEVRNLERELERLETLAGSAVSQEELDKQRYAVEEARAAAKLSSHQAGQTLVRAPFSGTITERHVDEGNLANTSTTLFSLADLRVIELELHLPEREAASVAPGSMVDVELVDDTTFQAEVVRKAPVVDPLTGTVKFTVHSRDAPPQAVPGAFARAKVLIEQRESAPSLPHTAIFELEGNDYVYVVEQGKAHRKPVKLGLADDERVEIVEGVGKDAVIIAEGTSAITEGMPVKPLEQDSDNEPANGS